MAFNVVNISIKLARLVAEAVVEYGVEIVKDPKMVTDIASPLQELLMLISMRKVLHIFYP